MLLYFPNLKIIRCDIIPNDYGMVYLFYLKSQINSPKHYPNHPLINGKIELTGKISNHENVLFWLKKIFNEENNKKIKGKSMSVLIEFNPESSTKLKLLGIGEKDSNAYFFSNTELNLSPSETKPKMEYILEKKTTIEKKKIKI